MVTKILRESMYVNDALVGGHTIDIIVKVGSQLIDILKSGGAPIIIIAKILMQQM